MTAHRLCGPDLAGLRVRPHETFRYRAGQYTALESARLPHTWRPYYLAGWPGRDGELEFHVRCTGPGGVSEALVRHTAVGDRIRLGPPRETWHSARSRRANSGWWPGTRAGPR
ncbi:FAD-binding oxidoreductase [Streptomyces sp. NPDC001276]|uniref:FAD-binding oxidoreductase n=1 Tax=Streptomyces sp. NPDC001276 TaxID=3364555 RepID=UPI003695D6C9